MVLLDRKIRSLMSNTFMSAVVVTALAMASWALESVNNPGSLAEYVSTDPYFIKMSIAGYCLMLVGFLVGMAHAIVRMNLLIYGMVLLIMGGWALLFAGTFQSDGFKIEGNSFDEPVAQLFGMTGICIQGLVTALHMRRELAE